MKPDYRKLVHSLLRPHAYWWYLSSVVVLVAGFRLSADYYPGGFDWHYRVASALASRLDNPSGSLWSASGLGLAMVLMWPYVSAVKKKMGPRQSGMTRFAFGALRTGLVCGMLLSSERLLIRDLSSVITKGHEIIALLTFFGLDIGVFLLLLQAVWRRRIYVVPTLLILVPLLAVGLNQFWLYLAQRDVGWVHTDWKKLGVSLWFSFALWQWLAIGILLAGLGLLSFISTQERER